MTYATVRLHIDRMNTFEAVADPTRRTLLDRLRASGPLNLSQLAGPLPITRQAVTKHLDVLARAGLVAIRRRGRERIHELERRPLIEVYAWLAPYAEDWDRRLERLRVHLGESD